MSQTKSGIYDLSNPIFDKDRDMVQQAYEILGISSNELIEEKKKLSRLCFLVKPPFSGHWKKPLGYELASKLTRRQLV